MAARAEAPIGVFDSGIGGLSVLRALVAELPHEDFVYFADTAHAPYGERGDPFVIERSHGVVQRLIDGHGIKALVVACNTATAAAIHLLRTQYPEMPIVGVEPALKPAVAATRTGRIGVLATRGTLASAKFRALHASLQDSAEFVLQPCDGLADAIERGDEEQLAALCSLHVAAVGPFGTAPGETDTLVLGCTHYPFVAGRLQACAGAAVQLLETGAPVARQARRMLENCGLLGNQAPRGRVELHSPGFQENLDSAASRWL